MKMRTNLKWILCVCFVAFSLLFSFSQNKDNYVLLISFDGFRHDYVEKFDLPNFKRFIAGGSSAEHMIPVYPTKTFPNHYTIVTGLYPQNHGLVNNSFYDAKRDQVYQIRKRELVEDAYFYGGTPLWQLCTEQGLKSASYFWVGSEAPIRGKYPDFYKIYDSNVSNTKRVKEVIDWFNLPARERPNFVTLYFALVDNEGHASGPNSRKTKSSALEADKLLGKILDGIDELSFPVNVLITSDHGMVEIQNNADYQIHLDWIIDVEQDSMKLVNSGELAQFYFSSKLLEDAVFDSLSAKLEHARIYKRADIPSHLHYNDHERIGDLLIIPDPGYSLLHRTGIGMNRLKPKIGGTHGYDVTNCPEMNAIFYARGPNIKSGYTLPGFENIHVYPFIAKILDLKIPKIDGKISFLQPLLIDRP